MTEVHTTRSSMLKTVGYDDKENCLTVTFANGGTYKYKDVPKTVFNELISAESEGKYFLANVKNQFEYEKE